MNFVFWDLHIWPSVFTKATLAPAGTFSPARPTLQNFFYSSMYIWQELNTRLLVIFLFATEALETHNCIKQWNEKHKGPFFGALLLLIADCQACGLLIFLSPFVLLDWWKLGLWQSNIKRRSRKTAGQMFIYRLQPQKYQNATNLELLVTSRSGSLHRGLTSAGGWNHVDSNPFPSSSVSKAVI